MVCNLFLIHPPMRGFENDVKMYGTQARIRREAVQSGFENDVKMYGM